MVTVHLISGMMALLLIPCYACPDPKKSVQGEHEGFNRPSLTPPTGRASPQPHLSQPEEHPRSLTWPGEKVTMQTIQTIHSSAGTLCALRSG